MIHLYDPKTMTLSYVQELNKWIQVSTSEDPLINCEWDIEYPPEAYERMIRYIRHQPDRIHVAPYLTNIHFTQDGLPLLFWAHRVMAEKEQLFDTSQPTERITEAPRIMTIEESYTKVSKTTRVRVRYPAWVAGGEPEADIVCLGFTYFPREWWSRIYPEVKNLDWRTLDIEISARMMRDGMKALIHWDCVVNHTHVSIREREKSVFRKWVGIDKVPLTDEESKWLKAQTGHEKLPRYHGYIGEPVGLVQGVEIRQRAEKSSAN